MNTRNRFLFVALLVLLAAFLFTVPAVFAQDGTPAPLETVAATAEATPAPDVPPVIPANNTGSILLVVGAILAIVAGGGGILSMVERFRQNRQAVEATEQLGDSVPRPIAEKLIEVIKILSTTGTIAIEALDGIPAASKIQAQSASLSQVSSEALAGELRKRTGWTVQSPVRGAGSLKSDEMP